MNEDKEDIKSEKSFISLKGNRLIRVTIPQFWTKKMTESLIESIERDIGIIGQGVKP